MAASIVVVKRTWKDRPRKIIPPKARVETVASTPPRTKKIPVPEIAPELVMEETEEVSSSVRTGMKLSNENFSPGRRRYNQNEHERAKKRRLKNKRYRSTNSANRYDDHYDREYDSGYDDGYYRGVQAGRKTNKSYSSPKSSNKKSLTKRTTMSQKMKTRLRNNRPTLHKYYRY